MALWADDDAILCVHPSGGRIVGAAAIRASYETALADGGLAVLPETVHRLQIADCSIHHLIERVMVDTAQGRGELRMAATNVYVRSALGGWRIAVHHATPAGPDHGSADPAPAMLH